MSGRAVAAATGGAKRAPPTRLSAVWARMAVDCPGQVAAYGKCVADNLDDLRRDACAQQFAAMRQCAQSALAAVRGGAR